jgi:hypothetical protein
MKAFLVVFNIFLFASCTKELKYTKEQLYDMAKDADATTTFILPRSMEEGVHCTDYPEGCVSAHTVQVQNLNFIGVEFLTEEQAKFAAKKFRGYYSRNWLFDDVAGEPTLEKFVVKSLEAKKP